MCLPRIWNMHITYSVVSTCMQNLAVIHLVVSVILLVWLERLEMPIHAPKIRFLGIWPLKWGGIWTESLKAHPCMEGRHMTHRSSNSVHWCDLCAWQSDQKNKDRKLMVQWKTGYSPGPPTSCIQIPFVTVGDPALVIRFKFHQYRLSGYWAVRGRNLTDFGRSHYLGQWRKQQPYGRDI